MKFRIDSLRNKIWLYLIIFSIAILSFLWLFQVIFLNAYYEWMKTSEINSIADKIVENYDNDSLNDYLDTVTYTKGICIEIIYNNLEIYSSNNTNRGCIGQNSSDPSYMNYKKEFMNSDLDKKNYKLTNDRFDNKILMTGVKLDEDYYVFINASIEPLTSTIHILASQLIYVTFLVMILSFLIAYYISKRISRPIIQINETAKKMAQGNYEIEFKTDSAIDELDELTKTLNQAKDELSKTDALRKELMANVSHDLKTPLTMIKAYAEMVRDLSYNNEEKRNNHLNTIIEETDRLNRLVNDMLELSKLESNIGNIHYELFDINELIKTVLSRFSYLEETKQYQFEYIGIENVLVHADKVKIEQVIYNLVGNAINYIGKDKKVIVKMIEEKSSYRIEIIDHGKGIDEKELDKIWDKYYKVDKTYKRNTIGTGLGLSIVKNILLAHQYSYGVQSKKGKGTTFYFEIPKSNKSLMKKSKIVS